MHARQVYTVGIICALDVEKAAVAATLDEEHGRMEKAAGDDNVYTFGRIGAHNVVVASLPVGVMGKVSATAVAKDMMRSFPIKFGLMVGICGGVWSERVPDLLVQALALEQAPGAALQVGLMTCLVRSREPYSLACLLFRDLGALLDSSFDSNCRNFAKMPVF
jgi:hypothetical protein